MKQTERKVGDVIYIDVDKTAQIYAIGSDGNDVRYYTHMKVFVILSMKNSASC